MQSQPVEVTARAVGQTDAERARCYTGKFRSMRRIAVRVLASIALAAHWGPARPASVAKASPGEPPICFVVVSNEANNTFSSRDLRLLIQEEAATEANFLALVQYFCARYPDAEHLRVFCETSLRFLLGFCLTQHDIDAIRAAVEGRTVPYTPKVWEADAQAVLE